MNKSLVRQQLLQHRDALTTAAAQKQSEDLCRRLLASEEYQQAHIIFAYLSFGREASLDFVLQQALEGDKIIGVPAIYGKGLMHMVRLEQLAQVTWDRYGIRTPTQPWNILEPESAELVLVPGVGFTARGQRLGMGQGFYDRYLPLCTKAKKIGVAYEQQLVIELPTETWDAKVDGLVTETRFIKCS